jgi:flagellar hook protein FlgE
MGLFGALNTAVTGMQAQSFALENVSGNIANSQTVGFKRIDTSFEDLIPSDIPSRQLAGSVSASSQATNSVQGNIQSSTVGTYMAINGSGFFVVAKPTSTVDGRPVFAGTDLYTRRGDFQPNKDGYLVNGAGNYLMGIPIDPTTGNLSGSVPQLLQFQNDFLPAQQTTTIEYRANLARYPLTTAHDTDVVGSELLNPINYTADPTAVPPTAAHINGAGATIQGDNIATVTGTATLPVGGLVNSGTITFGSSPGTPITFNAGDLPTNAAPPGIIEKINAALGPGITASLSGGKLKLVGADADTAITMSGSATALFTELGLTAGTTNPTNLLTQNIVSQGQTMNVSVGGTNVAITFGTGAGEVSTLAELSAALNPINTSGDGTAAIDSTGNISLTGSGSNTISVTGTATMLSFGMHTTSAIPTTQQVVGNDVTTFLANSVSGGAITAYDVSGSPVNVQLRWAKTDSASLGAGHTDTWNMFYQVSTTNTGTAPVWQNAGTDFSFDANGQMNPAVTNLTLSNVTIDGVSLGDVTMKFGAGGITQFSDPNGGVTTNTLTQNGFAAGTLQSITINDKGRVVGTYSNGRTIDRAQIVLANFSGANYLKRLDGGTFEATDDSGVPTYNASGSIVSSSLESSNTDIATEFTKLIVTQQAYSANTRVISTANQMAQDLLNTLR